MEPIDVSISAISVAYGDTSPLRGLSLDVRKGEFLSLLGPSGCGKTTTLRAVAGFIDPYEGDILVGGRSVRGVPPNRRNIGMVYQDYALFPHMTVQQNVAFGLKMRGVAHPEAAKRADELLAKLQLGGLSQRYASQLSGGQQQRVALARALVINPSVLLLDEPLAALDKQLRADMQFELRSLQREFDITAIFVTHDQEEALSLSDRIAVMSKGRILQVDTPRRVYDHPTHRFVAEFIGVANFLPARVTGANGEASVVELKGLPGAQQVPGRLARGDVELLVRPEHFRLATVDSRPPEGCNSVTGRVVNSVFQGSGVKYHVKLANGALVRVDVPVGAGAERQIGSAVQLLWQARDVRVYRGETLEA
jgi:spermidine/putrescine ABC transporter ATP-binding subunit